MIPKLMHVIWVGDESIRPDNCIDTWRRHHPDWTFKLWGNAALGSRVWRNAEHMRAMARQELNGVADMMRWEILADEGGVVVDADSACLQPLPDWLLHCEAFACWENEIERPGLIAAGYFGTVPGNAFVKGIVESIHRSPSVVNDRAWKTVGPLRLTQEFQAQAYTGLTVLPSHFFIPTHYSGRTYSGSGPIYATQAWASTNGTYGQLHRQAIDGRPTPAAGQVGATRDIPRLIHWIWLGPEEMPPEYVGFIDKARALHPDWTFKLWRDEDVRQLPSWPLIDKALTWAGKADIARYEILAQEGGIYLDCDIELLQPLEPIRQMGGLVVCNEDARFDLYCSIGFIAAPPGHPALARALAKLAQTDVASGPPNRVTGPWFWRTCLDEAHTLLPTVAFYPYLYDEPPEVLAERSLDGCYGIHHWAGSWLGVNDRLYQVNSYIDKGHFVAAATRIRELQAAHPEHPACLQAMGHLYRCVVEVIARATTLCHSTRGEMDFDLGNLVAQLGSLEAAAQTLVRVEAAAKQAVEPARLATPPGSAAGSAPASNTGSPPVSAAGPSPAADPVMPAVQAVRRRADAPDHAAVRKALKALQFRPNSDDDRFVIPELVEMNMFRMDRLASFAPAGPVAVVDCGAHIGVFSTLAALHLPQATVHAFEPQPDNFELLHANAQTLGQGRIVAHPKAVGPAAARLPLYRNGSEEEGYTGRWSMVPESEDLACIDRVDVEVVDLYAFLQSLELPLFALKLDLEGYEAEILACMPAALLQRIGILIIEEHHLPIDHDRLVAQGLQLAFHPLGSDRHFVYLNHAALDAMLKAV